ncbi:MAG: hypothetical protein FWF57_05180 [Defluviitaleaceae bacterium]|nr:hypothetical protein [Defluviitaleaceae bacterium]
MIFTVVGVAFVVWVASTSVFDKKQYTSIDKLGTWSRVSVYIVVLACLMEAVEIGRYRTFSRLFQELLSMSITTVIAFYLTPFFARYFYGVVLDGLEHHPDSKFYKK